MAKRKKAKKESRSTWKGINHQRSQKPRPKRGGMIPVIAVAAQKVHHLVHPMHSQHISSVTGIEKKNTTNHLTMEMQMHACKQKRNKIQSKSTEALSKLWPSKKAENWRQIQMAMAMKSNISTQNIIIVSTFIFIFLFVVATDNFEEFKGNIKHIVKKTTLPPDNTSLSYDTEFNGKVERKSDALI